MSMQDKAEHKGEELKGAIKESVGKLTDNHSLEAEGTLEKLAGKAKGVADDLRDDISSDDDERH